MRNYYTYYPICPFCLEPSKSDNFIIADEFNKDVYICPTCGSHFKNLTCVDKCKKNNSYIYFPLFSKINLNPIEFSYIDWILNEDYEGKYFITWPWDSVKFIPIFLSEYFRKNLDKKIIVLYDKFELNKFSDLNYSNILDSIFYIENTKNNQKHFPLNRNDIFIENEQGFCEIIVNTFNNDNIKLFKKLKDNLKNISFITDDLSYYNGMIFNCGFVDNENSCFKKFIIDFKELYGNHSIKQIYGFDNDNVEENGIFELNFFKKYSFDKNLIINENFCNAVDICYNNKYELISSFFNILYCFIDQDTDLNLDFNYYNLFFINQEILSDNIVDLIKKINPNLIIFPWADELLAKSNYNTYFRKPLFSLLGSENNILLFATDLNRRSRYQIGKNKGFIKNMKITPHTWDYKGIYDPIREKNHNKFTLFSSNLSIIHGEGSSLKIRFHECEELKPMDNLLEDCIELFYNNKEINIFIRELIRTPLYLEGEYTKCFKRDINLEYILAIVFNRDKEKWAEIMILLKKIYGYKSINKNPLLESILKLTNKYKHSEVAIVVHHWDIKKFKEILFDKIGDNDILVTKWNKLNDDIRNSSIRYVISTEFPTLTYDLYDSPLNEILIVGSNETINLFKIFKNNRYTYEGTKPIYLLSDNEKAPKLLKDLMGNIDIVFDNIDEFNHEVNKNNSPINKYETYDNLKKGEFAILVINQDNKAMFLPYKTIYIYGKDKIEGISISKSKKNYDKLINTKILINEQEMYDSLGRIFFSFVINNGNNIPIEDYQYLWDGFKDLIENMFEWCDVLHKIIIKESFGNDKYKNDLKVKLQQNLIDNGVNVKSKNYIKNNWLDDPLTLETDVGEIFTYEIECPKEFKNLYNIYKWISENYEEYGVSEINSYKTFAAAQKLRRIRLKFFRNEISQNSNLKCLCDEFQIYIHDKINKSNLFHVVNVKKVKIKEDVSPYLILNDYKKFIEV